MLAEDIADFLEGIPPFQFLGERDIQLVAEGVSIEFYPKGSTVLYQDGPPSEFLRVIKKGGARVFIRTKDGEEVLTDYRGEGEIVGFLSVYSGDRSRANVVTVEDTICYLIDKDTVRDLLGRHPAIREFFHRSFVNKYLDKTFEQMRSKSVMFGGGEKLLFTTPVGELATRRLLTAPEEISIRAAAAIMSENAISSLVIVAPDGVPVGIVTDRDLRDKVVAKNRSAEDPVSDIMSVSLIKAKAGDYCFEALLKMVRFNIHHLLVVDDGTLSGIVTNHDLMMLQGTSPISVAREIEGQHSIEGLMPISPKVNKLVGLLVGEGARAGNITRIIAEINDRLVKKVIEITEQKMGPPPVDYCWMALGSEGRKEQTFRTDQDNAIVYEDPRGAQEAEDARRYFSEFAAAVRDGLLQCGFPACPANYMASNPQWCQPLKTWKRYFANWIAAPTPEAVLKSLIFFDFRPLHGEFGLAQSLRESLNSLLQGQMIFLGYMANMIIKNIPPVGFFRSFIVETDGEHKNELNLKIKGIAPIVDIARLFSLEKGISETSTIGRIRELKGTHTIVKGYAEELEHAFEFIMLLRIQNQCGQMELGQTADNYMDPDKLSRLEKKTMKDAFHLISTLQNILIERYKPLIW